MSDWNWFVIIIVSGEGGNGYNAINRYNHYVVCAMARVNCEIAELLKCGRG